MTDLTTATILAALILVAAIISVEFGISVAIIEITLGVAASSLFGLRPTPWIDFIGSFAGIVLTLLAGGGRSATATPGVETSHIDWRPVFSAAVRRGWSV